MASNSSCRSSITGRHSAASTSTCGGRMANITTTSSRTPQIKQWYQDWVAHLLNRTNTITGIKYKDDPTIMSWELGNELQLLKFGSVSLWPQLRLGHDGQLGRRDVAVRAFHRRPTISSAWGGEGFLCTDPGGTDWLTNCSQSADPVALLALRTSTCTASTCTRITGSQRSQRATGTTGAPGGSTNRARSPQTPNKPYYIGEYGWVDLVEPHARLRQLAAALLRRRR